ncbi:MAG: 30S ribosomal protein S6, partial [Bacteroidales bacterium]|nr:30S ribosomal protein S6 [Bacteroidales bacterium]
MVNQYETVFIATPVLSDTQMKEAVAKYVKLITDNGGEVVYQEDWGLR